MTCRFSVTIGLVAALGLSLLCPVAEAQWSIGAPGSRQAPAGMHRDVFLVFANPIPGHEAEFNDWYTTVHLGDLVQVPGFVGAQRFRIVTSVTPRPTAAGYQHGYLVIWDMEDANIDAATTRMVDAIRNGKLRRGAAFDYTRGAAGSGMYEVMGPRITRPDGKGPVVPDRADPKVPRLERYILMDFSDPAPGKEAEFAQAMPQRIASVLAIPGWLAAQRFTLAEDAAIGGKSGKPRYLTVWEIQAASAQAAQDALTEATRAGRVRAVPIDEKTAEIVYWEPITPYVTREDFER